VKGDATLSAQTIAWQGLQGSWAGAKFDGSASKTLLCTDEASCAWHLTAHSPVVDMGQVQALFEPSGTDRLMGVFRAGGPGGWPLFVIDLSADALDIGPLTVAHASAVLHASGSNVKVEQCTGVTLGGAMECNGTLAVDRGDADLTVGMAHAGIANAGALFHEKWGKGTVETSVDLKLRRGGSASGDFTAMLRDVALSGVPPTSALAHADSWHMSGSFAGQRITLERSLLSAGTQQIPVTGTIGFDRRLDLTMSPPLPSGATKQHVGGTVQAPVLR
jgi:hypothetical protein